MFLYQAVVICTLSFIASPVLCEFRVLAPQFICPKDDDALIDRPDHTVITIQSAYGVELNLKWTVRWTILPSCSQRFTVTLWKKVRDLEVKLNGPQPESNVYFIHTDELLHGVNYIFTILDIKQDGSVGTTKTFEIDNTQSTRKLQNVDGQGDVFSIILVGGQLALVDQVFVVEAQVTTCYPTQNYYFIWTLKSEETNNMVDVSDVQGFRLEVSADTLKPGLVYDTVCHIVRLSDEIVVTKTQLDFEVLPLKLEVYLNADYLIVTVNQPFSLESYVIYPKYYEEFVEFQWNCSFDNNPCDDVFESTDNKTVDFLSGLSNLGKYNITLIVKILEQSASAMMTIKTVEPMLPVLQITPLPRIVNEGSTLSLVANVTNLAPKCTLTWYFASEEYLFSNQTVNGTCEDNNCNHQHGEELTDSVTILSLEENFLNELTDYTNETESRQVSVDISAAAGRARFVAECGCSLTFECKTEGMVYADLNFVLNTRPKVYNLTVSPETGVAMETIFRVSTLAASDPDGPLRYSFFCRVGDDDVVLLDSYLGYYAMETFLPYIESGTELWVDVCDAPGACATSELTLVHLSPGQGRTVDALTQDAKAHVRRCELILLKRRVIAAIVTYKNAGQDEILARFTSALLEVLPPLTTSEENPCITKNYELYSELLGWLTVNGVDISALF